MIEVKDLTKKYGDHTAVDHLNFQIGKGRVYGFLGPNGAGKTTTMNMMTGYIAPTEGTCLIDGHDVLEEPEEARRNIGYLPEIPPVYMDMTISEYLDLAADLKKVPKAEKKQMAEEVMQKVQIADMQGRLIKHLSKGYRQRVGLAQALMGKPETIILDEPTVGLDPRQIIEIRDLIRELGKEHTVILSSHILSEVSEICDYVMILSHGKMVANDTTENLAKIMQGQNSLELTLRADADRTEAMLAGIPQISSHTIRPHGEDAVDVTLKMAGSDDLREKIFYTCAASQCPILRMDYTHVSLEDIFLEVTEDAPAAKPETDADDAAKAGDAAETAETKAAAEAEPAKAAEDTGAAENETVPAADEEGDR
ncbi:MAG: ABC transporter ATP-binding protein [Lachnospiraceae bacterium]|nr:ABC transporter ATP-binding protein [Lachnospiraceae bacterium]